MHLELVLQFAAIITLCGVIVVSCNKVRVVTKHGVTASAGVTRADLTFRAGALDGRVLSKFFTNWGRSNLFYSQPGEGHSFFGKEKITPCRFYFVYTSKATSQD